MPIDFSKNIFIELYEEIYRPQYGQDAPNYITELMEKAKIIHHEIWKKSPTLRRDHEQSWRAYKGKNLELLILHIIEREVREIGLEVIRGEILNRRRNIDRKLSMIKRNVSIDYKEFGFHLPDVDLIIYEPKEPFKVLAVVSSKVTLRERIAQTGYWKIKFLQDEATKHVKVFFITPDEDGTLNTKTPAKKGRAIVEVDTDGCYVMTKEEIQTSSKVKPFNEFFIDLRKLIKYENEKKRK